MFASLLVLKRWHWVAKDRKMRRQANMIFYFLLLALILGSLTDVILSSRLITPLPQMAPVFIVIPIFAIYFFLQDNKIVKEQEENKYELILSHESQTKFYYYLATIFFSGAILVSLIWFLPQMTNTPANIKSSLFAAGLFFSLGIVIILSQYIKSNRVKNTLLLLVILASIPFITLSFLHYAGITAWVIPLVLMTASLIFNNKIPLYSTAAVGIITQIILWLYSPRTPILFDDFDYLLRIGIIIIMLWIGTIVNNIYRKRLQENFYQIEFQKLISEISSEFVSVDKKSIDKKIEHMLERTGSFFSADRTYVFLLNWQMDTISKIYDWYLPGLGSKTKSTGVKDIPLERLSWLLDKLRAEKLVSIEDTREISDELTLIKNLTIEQNIKSLVLIPIEVDNKLIGFIGLDSVLYYRKWSGYHIELLKILANLLADALLTIKSEEEIEQMAYFDYLTGAPNRILFTDRLKQAIHLAERNASLVAVVFIDIDSFKTINDTIGHSGGDAIIKVVAECLQQNIRKSDTLARYGGDEFLIMINNIKHSTDIPKIVENIMQIFAKPFILNEQEYYLTCSAGIAVYPYDGEDSGALIKNADIAMYSAKLEGKNRYLFCTEGMKEEVQRDMILSNHLYRALDNNELVLHYQPQVSLETGRITGLEALLRWQHPELGLLPPNLFIPIAEKNGLINEIGHWVIKTAAQQNKKWQDRGYPPLRMAVNLSTVQFSNPNIADNISTILLETGLDPKYLELELTESITIKQTADIVRSLGKLKNLGLTISIDDFGTEYSSLGRLKDLPVDRIKIDMRFIQAIERSEKDRAITGVIIKLARSLELKVLAEGVETKEQLEYLRESMCDDVQGFYFYRPIPPEEVEKVFSSH